MGGVVAAAVGGVGMVEVGLVVAVKVAAAKVVVETVRKQVKRP